MTWMWFLETAVSNLHTSGRFDGWWIDTFTSMSGTGFVDVRINL